MSAAAELAEFRKITKFQVKTQYLINTLYIFVDIYQLVMPAYLCPDDATLIMVDLYVRSFAKIDDVKMEYRYGKGLLDLGTGS